MRKVRAMTLLLALAVPAARGEDHSRHALPPRQPAAAIPAQRIADAPVRDESGAARHFYRDLVQGRLVAVNFVYTRCTTVCPLLGARFAQLQKLLGADAAATPLISVSIDPANDTPARLAQWSQALGRQPGWSLVTGARADMDTLLRSLGASAADPAAHAPIVLIIDDRGPGRPWRRLDGLADAATLAQALREQRAHAAP
jgi:protein SCO1